MTSNYSYTIQLPRTVHNLSFCSKRTDRRAAADTLLFSTSAVISVEAYKLSRTDD